MGLEQFNPNSEFGECPGHATRFATHNLAMRWVIGERFSRYLLIMSSCLTCCETDYRIGWVVPYRELISKTVQLQDSFNIDRKLGVFEIC